MCHRSGNSFEEDSVYEDFFNPKEEQQEAEDGRPGREHGDDMIYKEMTNENIPHVGLLDTIVVAYWLRQAIRLLSLLIDSVLFACSIRDMRRK